MNQQSNKKEYQKLLQQAKEVSIVSVMAEQGMPFIDLRNFAQGCEHDSLMIDKRKNRFYWNSQIDENGRVVSGDVVDFVSRFFDKSHIEAINYLTQEDHSQLVKHEAAAIKKEPFRYYFQNSADFSAVRNYLVNGRNISPQLVDVLHEKGFIQQDKYQQAIFVWSKFGKAVGATVAGTVYDPVKYAHGRFKGIARNSEWNHGFNLTLGTPTKLYVFEAPIDLLSYWTLNPQLKDCMLASMDGLKEEAVYHFIKQMHVGKGALPHEGIYLGVDNDAPGQRLYDHLSQLAYVDNDGREIAFKPLTPQRLAIPKENILIYHQAAEKYGVDWRAIAATHKAITNFSAPDKKVKIGNAWNVRTFFAELDYDLREESEKVAERLSQCQTAPDEVAFPRLFQKQDAIPPRELRGITKKIENYYDAYCDRGYRPMEGWIKDWNDQLRYQVFTQQEAVLLETIYCRNNHEKMTIQKDEQNKKYQALSLSEAQREPFFEADTPEEAAQLVKNFGFQAVDKEDRKKYGVANHPENKKAAAVELAR